jgi:hypothetical protein
LVSALLRVSTPIGVSTVESVDQPKVVYSDFVLSALVAVAQRSS